MWPQRERYFCKQLGVKMKLLICLSLLIPASPFLHMMSIFSQHEDYRKSDYVILSVSANETRVSLLLSQTLLIVLPAQMGTGYTWRAVQNADRFGTIEKLDSAEIQKLTKQGILEVASEKNLPGSSERQVFRLKPISNGTTQVELRYIRPWEPDKSERKFVVTLNINS
jgi:predicted secreted protein